ncbi:MAG TPA: phosphodiester glycosidase family protein [Bacillota bacterium]|nr:phosphodiester glycosidase family protein [Bacillota bacterium]
MQKEDRRRRIWTTVLSCLLILQTSTLVAAAVSQGPIKEQSVRSIAPGITYKEYSEAMENTRVIFRVVEVDLSNPNIKVKPIYGNNGQIGSKAKVTTMVSQSGAVAAINSSFFRTDNEGGTLGTIIKDGKILSNPAKVPGWKTLAFTKGGQAVIGSFGFRGQIKAPNGKTFPLEGLNKTEYFAPGSLASNYSDNIHLFTRDWSPISRGSLEGYEDILEVEVKDNMVTDIRTSLGPKPIPQNGYVLFANGSASQFLKNNFKRGDKVEVSYQMTPGQLEIMQAIGVNYSLVEKGVPVLTFPSDSDLTGKHSRSAIGIDRSGTRMYLVSVDRSNRNPGVTLPELANILINLGAYHGVNLDGGSSTSLVVRQPGNLQLTRVNDGSVDEEHPVADALGIFYLAPQGP